MKHLLALLLSISLVLSACDPAPAEGSQGAEPQATETSNPETNTEAQADPPRINPEVAPQNNQFKAFMEKYPLTALPYDVPWIAPELAKEWVKRPIDKADLENVCGPGKITKASDEQAFHAARFKRSVEVIVLITYFQGDFNERLVLTTHKPDGSFIAMETIHSNAEDQGTGYSSIIESSFKIFRSEMFYRTDERSGKQVPEVDHEDIFLIGEDGKISPQ